MMSSNRLKLNDGKTDVMLITHERTPVTDMPNVLKINDESHIKFNDSVKNLGVHLDSRMSMASCVNQTCRNLYFHIKNISKIRTFISEDIAKKLVTTLVLSKLDYCNSLFAGVHDVTLKRLQIAQNSAARMIKGKGRRCHITPILRELHWLPVQMRIKYKICLFVYKCLNNEAPIYLSSMIEKYVPPRRLRSSEDTTILVEINYKPT